MKKITLLFIIMLSFKAGAQSASASFILKKADSLYEIGDYSNAVEHYKKVTIESAPATKIAKAYVAIGNVPQALVYYEKAILNVNPSKNIEKDYIQIKFDFAKLLGQSSRFQKADSLFKKLSEQFPNNPSFLYQRALMMEAQNDPTAIKLYKQVFVLDTNHINSVYKIARNYIENRKFEESEPFVNKGLSVDSTSARFLTLHALKQFYKNDYHDAIAIYNRLIDIDESNIQIHENLASCYSYTYQFEKALSQLEILLKEFDDKTPKWHVEIAKLYSSLKDYPNAKRHMDIAIALQEIPLSDSYLELATIYKRNKNYKNEMNALKTALTNNPKNEIALFRIAVSADNYFADKKVVLNYYEEYLQKYSETGRMRNLAKLRVSDLKKELHFTNH